MSTFDAVVFAGGGSRCFWQVGFYAELSQHIELEPRQLAAVSAGAAMACICVTGRWDVAVEHFAEATAANERNFYPHKLLSRTPAFPHLRMYRGAILATMDDDSFDRLRGGPDVHVLLTRYPRWFGARAGALVAAAVYNLEQRLTRPVHTRWCRRIGFRPEVVRAADCASREELADLILHSSCTPPLTPLFRRAGAPVLDGGAIDAVPRCALSGLPRRTLVLLTSQFPRPKIPVEADVFYAQPSQPVPVKMWDYTNPEGIVGAFELGRADARLALASDLAEIVGSAKVGAP